MCLAIGGSGDDQSTSPNINVWDTSDTTNSSSSQSPLKIRNALERNTRAREREELESNSSHVSQSNVSQSDSVSASPNDTLSTIQPSDSISQVSVGSSAGSSVLTDERRTLLLEKKRILEQRDRNAAEMLDVINELSGGSGGSRASSKARSSRSGKKPRHDNVEESIDKVSIGERESSDARKSTSDSGNKSVADSVKELNDIFDEALSEIDSLSDHSNSKNTGGAYVREEPTATDRSLIARERSKGLLAPKPKAKPKIRPTKRKIEDDIEDEQNEEKSLRCILRRRISNRDDVQFLTSIPDGYDTKMDVEFDQEDTSKLGHILVRFVI